MATTYHKFKVGDVVQAMDFIKKREGWPDSMMVIDIHSHAIKMFPDDHPLGRWRSAECFELVGGPW